MSNLPFDVPENVNPCIFPDMIRLTHVGPHNTLYPNGKPDTEFIKTNADQYRNMNFHAEQFQCVQFTKEKN